MPDVDEAERAVLAIASGEWDEVSGVLEWVRREGIAARRQLAAYSREGKLADVVDLIAEETARGVR